MALSGVHADIEKTSDIETLIRRYITDDNGEALSDSALKKVHATINAIQAYANQEFPGLELLSLDEICVLTLSIWNKNHTPEKAFVATQPEFTEIRRTLSRFYCLHLLTVEGEAGYDAFVEIQEKNNPLLPVLSKENYCALVEQFQSKSPLALACLKQATIVSSVPLSSEAHKVAKRVFGENNYVIDSVEFPAKVFEDINNAKQIYPFIQKLFDQHPEQHEAICTHLKNCFPHGTHYRHQFYTEGNANMFHRFVNDVKNGSLTHDAYADWRDYWTINIMGFRGQVNPKGSLYLTEHTYRWMRILENELEQAFVNNSLNASDILNNYLSKRAQELELEEAFNRLNISRTKSDPSLPPIEFSAQELQTLAHIAAMLRFYDPKEGSLLIEGYQYCHEVVKELIPLYFDDSDPSEPTPTYAPALFTNAIDFRAQQYAQDSLVQQSKNHSNRVIADAANRLTGMLARADTVVACLPLYLAALSNYKEKRRAGEISDQPLCFKELASLKEITRILGSSQITEQFNILNYFSVAIADNGMIKVTQTQDCSERLAELLEEGSIGKTPLVKVQPPPALVQRFETERQQHTQDKEKNERPHSLSPQAERRISGGHS